MRGPRKWLTSLAAALCFCSLAFAAKAQDAASQVGREVVVPRHLQDGDEYQLFVPQLVAFGEKLFTAHWTVQEGAAISLRQFSINAFNQHHGIRAEERFGPGVEFLKTLQVLPPWTPTLVEDASGKARTWAHDSH